MPQGNSDRITVDGLLDPELSFELPVFTQILARIADLRGDKGLLNRRDFGPEDLRPWLSHVVLVDVEDGPRGRDYRFRLVGTDIANIYGVDDTGHSLSEFEPAYWAARSRKIADWVVDNRRPVRNATRVAIGEDRLAIEGLFLPLGGESGKIGQILAFLYFTPAPGNLRHIGAFQQVLRR